MRSTWSFTAFFTIALAAFASASAPPRSHRSLRALQQRAAEVEVARDLSVKRYKRLERRCNAHNAAAANSTSAAVATTAAISTTAKAAATTTTAKKVTTSQVKASSTASSPAASSSGSGSTSGHKFTLTNKCSNAVKPVFADTRCGYSPRCSDASSFSGAQPASLAAGATTTVTVDDNWVGRLFAQNGKCGASGEDCTMLEFNLDSGSQWTPQAYDISNIQGFTQSISVGADGCDTATCTSASCGCSNAYKVGDLAGCGGDEAVKACGAGNVGFNVVFCP
ncbi:hypothetical protein PLICRDRAFT_259166 [Plicaturopsis crispa FD-325 SS-3]|nr:hypothetical protein PLICRDRAFT_259166 [Plicaturopsis crispa FD-325 SS-3]